MPKKQKKEEYKCEYPESVRTDNDLRRLIDASQELILWMAKVDMTKAEKMSESQRSNLCAGPRKKITDSLNSDGLKMSSLLEMRYKCKMLAMTKALNTGKSTSSIEEAINKDYVI